MTIPVCTQLRWLCSTCLHVPRSSKPQPSRGDGQGIRSNRKPQDHLATVQTRHCYFCLILMAKPKHIAKFKAKGQGNVFYLHGRNPRSHDREYEYWVRQELGVNNAIYPREEQGFPIMYINKISPYDCTRDPFFSIMQLLI